MNHISLTASMLMLATIVSLQSVSVENIDMEVYYRPIFETYEPDLLDSCTVLIQHLEEEAFINRGSVPEEEFKQLFELLLSIEPEPESPEMERYEELTERARNVHAGYFHRLDIMPEDVDPHFIWEEIDTLISIPVLREEVDDFEDGITIPDSGDSYQAEADMETLKEKLPSVPLIRNKRVERAIKYFTTKGRKVMQLWLERSAEMIPIIQPILREEGLPDEIVYLAMIESGFKTNAYSWAHAAGPWQFISATGRNFGLEIDWWYDERRSPELSTRAAAKYLRELYARFGDWYLAMAAYNCGEGKVGRHVRTYGDDYWNLRRLPRQTRNYVPTYIGATIIAQNPGLYGFVKPDPIPPVAHEKVYIDECVDLGSLAKAAGIDLGTLKKHNPALVRWCTPPGRDSVAVYFPTGVINEEFWAKYAEIPAEKKVSYIRHRVRRGETLSTIASRYGVPMRRIIQHPQNRIRNRHRIRAGKTLIIPGITPERAKKVKHVRSEPKEYPSDGRIHIVRRGETLSGIASRYGVSVSQLKRLNRLYGKRYIYPRQRLYLYNASSADRSVVQGKTSVERLKSGVEGRKHIVAPGDTLWDISRTYGVSVESIRKANGLRRRSLIKPGQRLIIPTAK